MWQYDNIVGYLFSGIVSWQEMGYPIAQLWQISATNIKEKLEKKRYKLFLCVRTPAEWAALRIKETEHFPLTAIPKESLIS